MRKTYCKPQINVVQMASPQLCAASLSITSTKNTNEEAQSNSRREGRWDSYWNN